MWTIISQDNCKFCMDAISELKKQGQPYVVYNVKNESSRWIYTMMKLAGLRTVPQIFTPKGTYIGGYTQLVEHFNDSST